MEPPAPSPGELKMIISGAASTVDSPDHFPFTKLPPEIRHMAYQSLGDESENDKRMITFMSEGNQKVSYSSTGVYSPLLALTQTCKLLREEASPYTYKDIRFCFHNVEDDVYFDPEEDPHPGLPAHQSLPYSFITSVELEINVANRYKESLTKLMEELKYGERLTDFQVICFAGMWKAWAYTASTAVIEMFSKLRMRYIAHYSDDNAFRDYNRQDVYGLERKRYYEIHQLDEDDKDAKDKWEKALIASKERLKKPETKPLNWGWTKDSKKIIERERQGKLRRNCKQGVCLHTSLDEDGCCYNGRPLESEQEEDDEDDEEGKEHEEDEESEPNEDGEASEEGEKDG